MKIAETVTFGGSGLNRAAHLRNDPEALARAAEDATARTLLLWRGKVLMNGERTAVARLPLSPAALAEGLGAPFFLGLEDDGAPVFAQELTGWDPGPDDQPLMGFSDTTEQSHPGLPEGTAFCELRRVMTALTARDAELAATAKALLGWHHSHGYCARCGAASDLAQGGWQRICPACGSHHFPRTDPVVIMLITHGQDVLMGRSHGWPEGMYSLLAGFVEPGETLEAAVRREVLEESAIRVGAVDYLASQPWPFPASLMIGCRGEALSREITVDTSEIEHARWFSRAEILESLAGTHPTLNPARSGAIARFLLQNWLADRLD